MYLIGSWNTRNDPAARDYIARHHPGLWWIEADSTFRGMYIGGRQDGNLGNRAYVERYVRSAGALGRLFWEKKPDPKMGDTPSVLFLLSGPVDEPEAEHWGGSFVRPDPSRPRWTDRPEPEHAEGHHAGAKTASRWREQWLRDWQACLEHLQDRTSSLRP